ncbi:unnamed protein product, partial [Polarella glacialis]
APARPASTLQVPGPPPPPGHADYDPARMKLFIEATADLYAAAQAGDLETCLACLAKGAEPGRPNNWMGKSTPLHAAAAAGSLAVCQLLLDRGASVESRTTSWEGHEAETPEAVAARHGHQSVASWLAAQTTRV